MTYEPMANADETRVHARMLDGLKRLESRTRQPWSLEDEQVERWRLFRECVSTMLVREIQRGASL